MVNEEAEQQELQEQQWQQQELEQQRRQRQSGPEETFVGSWTLSGMRDGDRWASEDEMAMVKALAGDVGITFADDGTYAFDYMGESIAGTWEAKGAAQAVLTMDGDSMDATLADDTLSLARDEMEMTFERAEYSTRASGEGASGESDAGKSSVEENPAERDPVANGASTE